MLFHTAKDITNQINVYKEVVLSKPYNNTWAALTSAKLNILLSPKESLKSCLATGDVH